MRNGSPVTAPSSSAGSWHLRSSVPAPAGYAEQPGLPSPGRGAGGQESGAIGLSGRFTGQLVEVSTQRLPTEDTTADLVRQASEQISRLVRDELALARAEMTEKAKR